MDKIIGLITTTRSAKFLLIAELYGGPRFENREFFASKTAASLPQDEEEVADHLHELCKRDVKKAVREAIAVYRGESSSAPARLMSAGSLEESGQAPGTSREGGGEAAPAPAPIPAPAPEPPPAPIQGQYTVAEKAPPASATVPVADAVVSLTPKILSERLKAKGLTSEELAAIAHRHFPTGDITKAQYVEAFTAAEARLTKDGIEALRAWLKGPPPVEDVTEIFVFQSDPAVKAAIAQVSAKWPMWSQELIRVASLWCADHAKNANTLDAFLVAGGVNATTPPGRIESVLAITRHLSLSSMQKLLDYAKRTGSPFSMIESDLSAAMGKPIRFAMDFETNAVAGAFARLIALDGSVK